MALRCKERGARLLDFVVDFGAAKGIIDEILARSYLCNGRASVLLVVRVPVFGARSSGDLLESLAMPKGQAVGWLTVPEFHRLSLLLPPAVGVPGMSHERCDAAPRDARSACRHSTGLIPRVMPRLTAGASTMRARMSRSQCNGPGAVARRERAPALPARRRRGGVTTNSRGSEGEERQCGRERANGAVGWGRAQQV